MSDLQIHIDHLNDQHPGWLRKVANFDAVADSPAGNLTWDILQPVVEGLQAALGIDSEDTDG